MPSPFPNLPVAQRGSLRIVEVRSELLKANPWNDPSVRDVLVWTPAGHPPDRPLPAVLVLPAFAGSAEGLLARGLSDVSITTRFDRMIAEGVPPFAAVMPDGMTSLGGSQWVDSPGMGAYASWVVTEVMPAVAASTALNGRWAVCGRSSGGFGALHLAMQFPGTFRAVASMAGDCGFDLCYLGDLGKALDGVRRAGGLDRFVPWFWEQERPSGSAFAALNVLAMSCCYSPDPSASPIPARFPVDFASGAVDLDVLTSWRAYDPLVQIGDPAKADALRALSLLFVDAGRSDEYGLQFGARRLASACADRGIPVQHEEFDGGHRGTAWRYDRVVPLLVNALA